MRIPLSPESRDIWRKRRERKRLEAAKNERQLAAADIRFTRQARKLLTEWLERLEKAEALPPSQLALDENPDDWLRRMTYRLIRKYAQQTPNVIPDLIKNLDKRHMRGKDISGNPFKQGLLLIYASPDIRPNEYQNSNGSWSKVRSLPNLISDRRRRAELADAMLYAHLHDVPSKNFNGFRKQVGVAGIKTGLADGRREPGFSKPKR